MNITISSHCTFQKSKWIGAQKCPPILAIHLPLRKNQVKVLDQKSHRIKKKFEKQVVNLLSKIPANFLKEELKTKFFGEHTPNANEFVKMVSSAK